MTTSNYQWPEIAAGQAQKEVTHNDGLLKQDAAFGNKVQITVTTANVTLTDAQHNQNLLFEFIGAMDAGHDVVFKGRSRFVLVMHSCTGGQVITVKAGSGAGASVGISNGDKRLLYIDGAANAVLGPF